MAASTSVFFAATALCIGWVSGLIPTTGVMEPSGLDGIFTFWLGLLILRVGKANERALFVYMKELVRATPEARNELLGIEKEPESVILEADEEVGKRAPGGS